MSKLHKKIGDLLQIERTRQQLLLKEISEELNITVGNLEALEAGDVDSLPTEMYFNLFAKTYAEYLGIDYSRTVEAIKEELPVGNGGDSEKVNGARPDTGNRPQERKQAHAGGLGQWSSGKRLVGIVAITVVLLVAVVGLSKLLSSDSPNDLPSATQDDPRTQPPALGDAQAPTTADLSGYDWNVPEPAAPSDIRLQLRAREESWATVLADGDTAVYRNLTPFRDYEVEAKYRLLVSIGIPSVVEISLNGEEVSLVDSVTKRISRVEINQANLASFLNRPGTPSLSPAGEGRLTTGETARSDHTSEMTTSDNEATDTI